MSMDPGEFIRGMSQFEVGQLAYPRRSSLAVGESEAMHALLQRDPELIRAIVDRRACLDTDETIELEELKDPKADSAIPCVMDSMARSDREVEKIIKRDHREGETITGRIVDANGERRGSIALRFDLDTYAGMTRQAVRRLCELFETTRPSEDERPSGAQESSTVMISIYR